MFFRTDTEDGPVPKRIANLWKEIQVDQIVDAATLSYLESSLDVEFQGLCNVQNESVWEGDFRRFLAATAFPQSHQLPRILKSEALVSRIDASFPKCIVPGAVQPDDSRVSIPHPDLSYGYTLRAADNPFSVRQERAKGLVKPSGGAVGRWYSFPFLGLEFKGGNGKTHVARNQLMGASTACVNLVEGLNAVAKEHGVVPIDSTAIGITANEMAGAVHATWKDGDRFYVQKLQGFFLEDKTQFRKA